jgi:hypothetical protein
MSELAEEVRRLRKTIDNNPGARGDDVVEELSSAELQTARDKRDSLRWYSERSGFSRAEELVSEELIELVGTADLDELDELLGSDDVGPTDREKEIAECKERISFYERHNYGDILEDEYDRLAELKEGG